MRRNQSRLFFIEFLIVLFFFFIISAVCVRAFSAANRISRTEQARSRGQSAAASAAELLQTVSTVEALGEYFPEATCAEHALIFSYDKSAVSTDAAAAYYTLVMTVTPSESEHMLTLHVEMTDLHGETVYTFETVVYRPLTFGEVSA